MYVCVCVCVCVCVYTDVYVYTHLSWRIELLFSVLDIEVISYVFLTCS